MDAPVVVVSVVSLYPHITEHMYMYKYTLHNTVGTTF